MRKTILYIVSGLSAMVLFESCWQINRTPSEIITNENTEADFGIIEEKNGPVQTKLIVKNESADTLFPLGANTHCRCVKASVDRKPVPPGGNLAVDVVYNPAYRKGIFMEEIGVGLRGRNMMSLIIKGEIIPMEHPVTEDNPYDYGSGLHLSHEALHFGNLEAGEKRDIYIRYANDTGKPFRLSFEAPDDRADNISFRNNVEVGGKVRDTLHFHFTMPDGLLPGDTLRFPMQVRINDKPSSKILEIKAIFPENEK